ncbi:MAG: T9SS type A sorting domain-containing protein [Lewinellaceae bacterium]|nr:T9SS type A sorting domain-containing protein [Lewinellaceae bacterium]
MLAKKTARLLFVFLLFPLLNVAAQSNGEPPVRCNTTQATTQDRMAVDPAYRSYIEQYRRKLNGRIPTRNPDCSGGPVIIPVAVHYNTGVVPAGQEQCAVGLALDQISSLNAEINGNDPQNSAFSNFASCFGNVLGNACVVFCLAQYGHPAGYGLAEGDYAVTIGQVNFSNTSGGSSVPRDNNWAGYLNIYVSNGLGSLLGQAAGIPGNFSGEGVIIAACTFGTGNLNCPGMNSSASCGGIYDEGNTLTHEVGHYLGLYHIWGDDGTSCSGSDQINDTPNMGGNYSGYTSCGSHNSCSDLPTSCGSEDMYMNYMSYAGDICMYMFTSDQADVMHFAAQNAGFSTATPGQCQAPVIPVASFNYSSSTVCPGGCISFADQSQNFPISWAWSFSAISGDITTDITSSTQKNPTVCLTGGSSGTLRATLTASNSAGSSSPATTDISVTVLPDTDPLCIVAPCTQYDGGPYIDLYSASSCFEACPTVQPGYQVWQNESYLLPGLDAGVTYTLDFCNGYSAGAWAAVITIANFSYTSGVGAPVTQTAGCNLSFTPGASGDYIAVISGDGNCGGAEVQQDNGFITFGCTGAGCVHCGNTFTDDGGPSASYLNNSNKTYTICPDNVSDVVTVAFTALDIEPNGASNCYDQLSVYEGSSAGGSPVASFCGSSVSSIPNNGVFSGNGPGECLTFLFQSDGSVRAQGWQANISCSLALPVELSAFGAKVEGEHIRLDWTTQSESNNQGFYLQRQAGPDGKFTSIAFIEGAGSSLEEKDYRYTDTDVLPNTLYYYRLQQVDFDGRREFSNIVSARVEGDKPYAINVYPNPVKDRLNITYFHRSGKAATLFIYNSVGQLVLQQEVAPGEQGVDLPGLEEGVYWLRIEVERERVFDLRIVKMK